MGNMSGSNVEPISKSLSLVSWHMFTIMLVVGAGALSCVAYKLAMAFMAYPIILVNAGGTLMFAALGVVAHGQLLRLPGMYLMGCTAILAWLGIA